MRDLPYESDFDALECYALEREVPAEPMCKNCGLAPQFEGGEDCLQCTVAYLLTDPTQLGLIRHLNSGKAWLSDLNTEVSRQLSALIDAGRMTS